MAKFNVTLITQEGSLDNKLFETMAKKGDITSISVTELVGKKITIDGTATARIETDTKTFDLCYYNTKEYGIIHTGANTLFVDSVSDYSEYTNKFVVAAIKCKLGIAYKAAPVMEEHDNTESQTIVDDIPF